ncbi:hypothetical protein ACLOJK_013288 [Asimina triloba]
MGSQDHPDRLSALGLSGLMCFPMALKAAVELKVFEIIAAAGEDGQLTASEMVAKMPTANPCAAAALERILRILVSNSMLTMSTTGSHDQEKLQAVYGLTSMARRLLPGNDGLSLVPLMLFSFDKATTTGFYNLKDAVLDGSSAPFEKAHGRDFFEFAGYDAAYSGLFHESMSNIAAMVLNEVLPTYRGFDDVKELVDVGGGIGTSISLIVSKYPHIRGVNFDFPYVIQGAPHYPGIEHFGGDALEGVPTAETIFMRGVLHCWDDGTCLKLLKNCWNALPDGGKVICVEFTMPTQVGTGAVSCYMTGLDLFMMACCPGGRERTASEYCELATMSGFATTNVFHFRWGITLMEFYKNA